MSNLGMKSKDSRPGLGYGYPLSIPMAVIGYLTATGLGLSTTLGAWGSTIGLDTWMVPAEWEADNVGAVVRIGTIQVKPNVPTLDSSSSHLQSLIINKVDAAGNILETIATFTLLGGSAPGTTYTFNCRTLVDGNKGYPLKAGEGIRIDAGATTLQKGVVTATKANPAVFTLAAHGFKEGDIVGFSGTVNSNGWAATAGAADWIALLAPGAGPLKVHWISANTFQVYDKTGVAVDGSGSTAALTSTTNFVYNLSQQNREIAIRISGEAYSANL